MTNRETLNNSAAGAAATRDSLGVTPDEFREMGRIGAMYYEQGNLKKAQAIFETLVEMDSSSAAAHSALGALLTRREEYADALPHLDRAVELDPKQIAPY